MGGPTPTRASRGCILAPPDRGAMGLGSGNTLGRGSYACRPGIRLETNETTMRLIPWMRGRGIHLGEARTFEARHETNETMMRLLLEYC